MHICHLSRFIDPNSFKDRFDENPICIYMDRMRGSDVARGGIDPSLEVLGVQVGYLSQVENYIFSMAIPFPKKF
jgi:hypothetical protein